VVKTDQYLSRSGALEGDLIGVSGTIGDGAIGLALKSDQIQLTQPTSFITALEKTDPRCTLGLLLVDQITRASSCLDISDGLIQDLTHILKRSNCSAEINIDSLPISTMHQSMLDLGEIDTVDSIKYALFGGDDYELLFTISSEKLQLLEADLQLTVIGKVIKTGSTDVNFISKNSPQIAQALNENRQQAGWDHFSNNNNNNSH
jgi:thiamine-monophosphate kinase